MLYTLKRDDMPLLSQWIKKYCRKCILFCSIFWRRRRHTARCAELHRKQTAWILPHSLNFCGSRELVLIHKFSRAYAPKKGHQNGVLFFGAEDEIRTRATVSHTTPLAGEPLEPLGYFCMAQFIFHFYSKAILLYHIFLRLSKHFTSKNKKCLGNFPYLSQKNLSKHLTSPLLSIIIILVQIISREVNKL